MTFAVKLSLGVIPLMTDLFSIFVLISQNVDIFCLSLKIVRNILSIALLFFFSWMRFRCSLQLFPASGEIVMKVIPSYSEDLLCSLAFITSICTAVNSTDWLSSVWSLDSPQALSLCDC